MSEYTKGPWFTCRPHGTIYIEARLLDSTIQEIAACGPTAADGGYGAQQEANALLIAAAPELLEALKEITALAEQVDGWESFPSAAIDKARAAISKATGGQL